MRDHATLTPNFMRFVIVNPCQFIAGLRKSITKNRKQYKVQCFPLYSLILGAGNPTIDYLSLDIEGAELKVLQTIPFSEVDIRVVSVEVLHVEKREVKKLMAKNGYRVLRDLKNDIIFCKQK